MAAKLDVPKAMRAVGHANGSNPISVVLPCHRLIGANGSLVKYGGGAGAQALAARARRRGVLARAGKIMLRRQTSGRVPMQAAGCAAALVIGEQMDQRAA